MEEEYNIRIAISDIQNIIATGVRDPRLKPESKSNKVLLKKFAMEPFNLAISSIEGKSIFLNKCGDSCYNPNSYRKGY